jgi:hypothetical protein
MVVASWAAREDNRASMDGTLPIGVGVPMETRLLAGGGPIEPSIPRPTFPDTVVNPRFARTLLPSVTLFATVEGVSGVFRSLPETLSFPESDMTEGGRDIPGVEKATESRRW